MNYVNVKKYWRHATWERKSYKGLAIDDKDCIQRAGSKYRRAIPPEDIEPATRTPA